jgi:hypothetical protein
MRGLYCPKPDQDKADDVIVVCSPASTRGRKAAAIRESIRRLGPGAKLVDHLLAQVSNVKDRRKATAVVLQSFIDRTDAARYGPRTAVYRVPIQPTYGSCVDGKYIWTLSTGVPGEARQVALVPRRVIRVRGTPAGVG